jgi:hypothetical protein
MLGFMKRGSPNLAFGLSLACGALAPLVAAATASGAASQPFEHYQPILDRMPFGEPPPAANANAAAPAATDAQTQADQQKLAKQINMSCINVTPGGLTAIGFTDLGEKPPQNYYLVVGDNGGGWTVLNADYDEEWAQIEKDGVTITLKLGKGLIDAPPAAEKAAATAQAPAAAEPAAAPSDPAASEPFRLKPGLVRRPAGSSRAPLNVVSLHRNAQETDQIRQEIKKLADEGGDVGSYMERLRERKAKEKAEKDVAEKAARDQLQELARKITEEELKKREREINLSLLEQGASPVSDIELTPEEENALVQKGILPQLD